MPKVNVLPADVIARIAAGEVVDRPASVVKELMENSLDAGATRVAVDLVAGGKTLIEIRDNGHGVGREDLDVLFTRHATSKVKTGEDLENILSFGFRGEALYSIGSVAELTLKSRVKDAADGFLLQVKGGVKKPVMPAALPSHGTHIRVEEIFFNTPARKKFLKADATEFDQCAGVFLPYALLHHDRHFVLTHHGRTIYDLPPESTPAARAARALALEASQILTMKKIEHGELRCRALLGDINIQRPRRDLQFIFVNGRPVQSRGLVFHMNDIYRLIMPEGVHPFFVLAVDLPPGDVDVNIHPAKREVRIRDEGRIGALLRRGVEQALMTQGSARTIQVPPADVFSFPGKGPLAVDQGVPSERLCFSPRQRAAATFQGPAVTRNEPAQQSWDVPTVSARDRLARARFLGTFMNKYHLFEEGEALFVIDQHAAQERIMFERFSAQMQSGKVEVQRLLLPLALRLSPRELEIWEQLREALAAAGFESGPVGEGSVAVHTHPQAVPCNEQVFRALLADEGPRDAAHDMIARRACRASVMSGDRMTGQAEGQLKMLLSCADPFTCPHGRPVFIELKSSFLDRQFFRTS